MSLMLKKQIEQWKDAHLFALVHAKQVLSGKRFAKKHYSQFGEDIILQKLLPEKTGLYVDVGAFHPFHYSNTYVLYKRGWRGVNIDPNPESISLFEKYRTSDKNIRCGIALEKGDQTYHVYNHQSCNTFSKDQAEQNESKSHLRLLRKDKVPCLPLHTILRESIPEGVHVDLLNIDVEGMDLLVLQTVDWKKFAPRIVVVESEVRKGSDLSGNATYKFLNEKGYELRAWMGASLIFERVVSGK